MRLILAYPALSGIGAGPEPCCRAGGFFSPQGTGRADGSALVAGVRPDDQIPPRDAGVFRLLPRTWLIHKTGITQGAAAGRVGWSRRVQAHPPVAAARPAR
jgi:hypothetical protein